MSLTEESSEHQEAAAPALEIDDRKARKRRNSKRRLIAYGTIVGLIVGFYFYQPQRINFFPEHPPRPYPPVDPDSARLFSKGVKIAVIQAHPDDSEFFLAPLLLRLAASGAEIHQLVMTDGDKGFYFWTRIDPQLRKTREAEQVEAASHYAKDVTFLHRPDGRLAGQSDNTEQVHAFLQKVQPDYVIAFDPEYWPRVNHADHLASGRAAVEAVKRGDTSVTWLLLYDTTAGNFYPDVSKTVDEGVDMLAIHKSQFYGQKLEMLKNMRLEAFYDAGQASNGNYAVALRAVRIK